ncbi:MAG: helix-turn-helix domain-containing protein [Phenylobacterium sp.]|uniref:helix-turn-helix domain-containing protein n=1 Tax=Phenylobacterium sp. TaxID=1871053 RepID=UPI003918D5AA
MTGQRRYLVLDDDADVLKAAAFALAGPGVRVDVAPSLDGLEALARGCDAVLLDLNFAVGRRDAGEGLDALARLGAADPALSVVLMTAFGGVALAVETLKRGGVDFILKPWRNEALAEAMDRAAAVTDARRAEAGLDLEAVERRAIMRALEACEGNITRAASLLGLTRPALYRRIERHGL